MKRLAGILLVLCLCAPVSFAQEPVAPRDAARAIGEAGKTQAEGIARGARDKAADIVPGFMGEALPETGLDNGSMDDAARRVLADENDPRGQAGDHVVEGADKRPQILIDADVEPWLGRARAVGEAPEAGQWGLGDFLTGNYKDCQAGNLQPCKKERRFCEKRRALEDQTCSRTREVDVEAEHFYACEREADWLVSRCDRSLAVSCGQSTSCTPSGLVAQSIESDMRFSLSGSRLSIGTIRDNYWRGSCATFNRTITFTIRDVESIQSFRLTDVGFDDWIWLRLNGHTIYTGPYGGDRIGVQYWYDRWGRYHPGVYYGSEFFYGCELNESWHVQPNVDLRPYLREGVNRLTMRVIVSGAGEGWLNIHAQASCCLRWEEEWSETCAP